MKLQIYSALRRRIRAIILCGIVCIYSLISSAVGATNTERALYATEDDNFAVVSFLN